MERYLLLQDGLVENDLPGQDSPTRRDRVTERKRGEIKMERSYPIETLIQLNPKEMTGESERESCE